MSRDFQDWNAGPAKGADPTRSVNRAPEPPHPSYLWLDEQERKRLRREKIVERVIIWGGWIVAIAAIGWICWKVSSWPL